MSHFSELHAEHEQGLTQIQAAAHQFVKQIARDTTHDLPDRDVVRWYFQRVFPEYADDADTIYYDAHCLWAYERNKAHHHDMVSSDKFHDLTAAVSCSTMPRIRKMIHARGGCFAILSCGWYAQYGAVATGYRMYPVGDDAEDDVPDGEYYVGKVVQCGRQKYRLTGVKLRFLHDGPVPDVPPDPQEDMF